jgi:ferric-dicitrate binding protein FerR (iron transport regulator)
MAKFDTTLLDKYLKNQCTVQEAKLVLQWLETPEGQQYYAERIDAGLARLDQERLILPPHPVDYDKILQAIYTYEEGKDDLQPAPARLIPLIGWGHWWKVAASVSGLLLVAVWLFFALNKQEKITTAYGEIRTISLPDGSSVTLNSNSSLRYTNDWDSQTPREVWVEGEAFFSVIHTFNHQKFIVHSKKLLVEVLGTQFSVDNRRERNRVVLNNGKVQLKNSPEAAPLLVMKPGEMVEFSQQRHEFKQVRVDAEQTNAWRNNKLIFDNTPLSEIFQLLEDNYGIQVQIKDSTLLTKKYKGSSPSTNSTILLEKLAKLYDLKIRKEDEQIIVTD